MAAVDVKRRRQMLVMFWRQPTGFTHGLDVGNKRGGEKKNVGRFSGLFLEQLAKERRCLFRR